MNFLVALIVLCVIVSCKAGGFSYRKDAKDGPQMWGEFSPICNGKMQSPINIETSDAIVKQGKLEMVYYKKEPKAIKMTNNGHTIGFMMKFGNKSDYLLNTNALNHLYEFKSAHFHWGEVYFGGSEHTIDGHRYAAELHLVHFNTKYNNFEDAKKKPDGLAVVAILFEISEESTKRHENSNVFIKFLKKISNPNTLFVIKDKYEIFTMKDLIKHKVHDFYTYKGSLTTPPCEENVQWIISKNPIRIFPSEIAEFNKIRDDSGVLTNNFRPLQPLNGRKIFEYKVQN